MVGLPGAGKTTVARALEARHRAIRLTPDEWMIPLFGESDAGGKRDVLEGRLIAVALRTVQLGTSAVLDFGLWGRDERSALRWLAAFVGADSEVVYLPVDSRTQLRRIAERSNLTPEQTFSTTEGELDAWRTQFEVPDSTELDGSVLDAPAREYRSWADWASRRWPSLPNVTEGA